MGVLHDIYAGWSERPMRRADSVRLLPEYCQYYLSGSTLGPEHCGGHCGALRRALRRMCLQSTVLFIGLADAEVLGAFKLLLKGARPPCTAVPLCYEVLGYYSAKWCWGTPSAKRY
jgi:hypothetical protein